MLEAIVALPFVVQTLQQAFARVPGELLQAAATLGFAHTVGEFGVVLMIEGNISGETQVLSIALYDYVESLRFTEAHQLAGGLVAFSVVTLFLLYRSNPEAGWRVRL
jgi:molybdate transport system permease protein